MAIESTNMTLNKSLIVRIINEIRSEPKLFNMRAWAMSKEWLRGWNLSWVHERQILLEKSNICGTVCCIAGHAVRLADPELFEKLTTVSPHDFELWILAGMQQLGLTRKQALVLFQANNWPNSYQMPDHILHDPEKEAHCAVKLLQAVLDTEGEVLND